MFILASFLKFNSLSIRPYGTMYRELNIRARFVTLMSGVSPSCEKKLAISGAETNNIIYKLIETARFE